MVALLLSGSLHRTTHGRPSYVGCDLIGTKSTQNVMTKTATTMGYAPDTVTNLVAANSGSTFSAGSDTITLTFTNVGSQGFVHVSAGTIAGATDCTNTMNRWTSTPTTLVWTAPSDISSLSSVTVSVGTTATGAKAQLKRQQLTLTKATTGFSAQPTAGSITTTGVTISATPTAAVNIKCGVFADGATAPTADQVYAGTGAGGAGVGATDGPVVAVVEGTNGGAGVAITNIAVTGLAASTAYDIYCATYDGTKVLSSKVDFTTANPTTGFSAQPTAGSITTTGVTISATPTAAVNIKCGVFADGATAPTADQVYAGTGAGGAGVGATDGPVVAVVEGTNGGAGVAITNIAVTGLAASTAYDIYCATNDGTKVLSSKVDFNTASPTSPSPSASAASSPSPSASAASSPSPSASAASSPSPSASAASNTKALGSQVTASVDLSSDKTSATFTVTYNGNGWVGLGVGTSMTNTDMVICSGSPLAVKRYWSTGQTMPSGGSAVAGASCTYSGGKTTMTFTRNVAASGNQEKALSVIEGAETDFIWAYKTSTTLSYHTARGAGVKWAIVPSSSSPSASPASSPSPSSGAVAASPSPSAAAASNTKALGSQVTASVALSSDKTSATFTVTYNGNGWVGLGVGTSMTNTDMVICSGSPLAVKRYWSTGQTTPSGGSALAGASCTLSGGKTTMTFTRNVAASGNQEKALSVIEGAETDFIWAYKTSTTLSYHTARGAGVKWAIVPSSSSPRRSYASPSPARDLELSSAPLSSETKPVLLTILSLSVFWFGLRG